MKQPITSPVFSADQVYAIIEKHPGLSLGDISKHLEAGLNTTRKLIDALIAAGEIKKIQKGHPKRPTYEYVVNIMAKVQEINTKCKQCKYEDTRQLNPAEVLACPSCSFPLCVTGFQIVEM